MKTNSIDYNKLYNEARKMFFEKNEVYSFERKAENLAYLLGLETALRVSDLLEMKYSFFTYNDKIKKYCFTTKIKKTKEVHTGVISNELYSYIQNFKESVTASQNVFSDNIFYNYKTRKIFTRQWLNKRIKIISDKLGFENCSVHSIRRASAINVLDRTGSLSLAQYHLTHKRATTTDNYLSITKTSAIERLAKIY